MIVEKPQFDTDNISLGQGYQMENMWGDRWIAIIVEVNPFSLSYARYDRVEQEIDIRTVRVKEVMDEEVMIKPIEFVDLNKEKRKE